MKNQRGIVRSASRAVRMGAVCACGLLLSSACTRARHVEAQGDSAAPPTVAVVPVTRKDLARDFEIAAEFRPYQEINVYAKVAGYVQRINVDIGDRVKQGELLAILEVPEIAADLDHAKAAVRRSQDELKRAEQDLRRAKSAHEVAHLEYSRLAEVAQTRPGLVAQQEIDDARGRDQEAEAQVAAAQAGLEAAQEQLQVDQATLQREQSLTDYSRITAPFNGVVTQRYADTGAMVAAGTSSEKQALPVVQLAQNDLLRLDIPVPESIVPRIHVGTPVAVRVPALGKTYQGKVVRFADQVDLSTRTMTTEIDVPNPGLELVPGMYAYATLTLERKPDALAVPVLALIHAGGQTKVYEVNAGDRIEEKVVALGIQTPSEAEVLSGLREGDRVVVGQQSQLQPGEKVSPKLMSLAQISGNGAQ
jgi:RND family efflux transporter MFP subunit